MASRAGGSLQSVGFCIPHTSESMTPRTLDAMTYCSMVTVWWRLCAPHPRTGGAVHNQLGLCRSQHIFVCAGGRRGDSLAYTCVGDPGNALTCNDGYHVRALLVRVSVRILAGLTCRMDRKLCIASAVRSSPVCRDWSSCREAADLSGLLNIPARTVDPSRVVCLPAPVGVRARLSHAESCAKIGHTHQHSGQ